MKLYALSLIAILFSITSVKGADGCIRISNGTLYTTKSGSNYTGGTYSNPHSSFCIKSKSGSCAIKIGGTTYSNQQFVTYAAPIGCPLDDYVYILISLIAIGGFAALKKSYRQQLV